MMDNLSYEEMILEVACSIDNAIEQMGKVIVRKSICSFAAKIPSSNVCENILELTERKKRLVELNEILMKVVSRLTDEEKQLICYKYYGAINKNFNFDLKSRTYFRKQHRVLRHLGEFLNYVGLGKDNFIKKYMDIPFIKSIAYKYLKTARLNEMSYVKEILG